MPILGGARLVPIDTREVARIAALARLELDTETLAALRNELEAILGYVAMLDTLGVADVVPSARAREERQPLRADEPAGSLSAEEAVAEAPESFAGLFRVPRVLGD